MFDDDTESIVGTVMGDLSQHGLLMFLMMFILVLPFINDPRKNAQSDNIDPPDQGILRVEMFWEDERRTDVDLWVAGPIGSPVGYSNLGGPLFNLLRDDLGKCNAEDLKKALCSTFDVSDRNMEIAYTRGLWDGEYQVNVHLFNIRNERTPVPVRVVVSMRENASAPSRELFYSNVTLKFPAQELTVFRFMVKDNVVVMDSLNSLHRPIRPHNSNERP